VLLDLKRQITYGPVDSRRLGRSLGINLMPGRRKVCSLDCRYCQYGRTEPLRAGPPAHGLPTPAEVVAAVTETLERLDQPPQWLTFSGNGEPTLHPEFPTLVDLVNELRDRDCPEARTAALSNSTTVGRPEVRAALTRIDLAIMKLDCGDEESFRAFNRPAPGVSFEEIVDGLTRLGGLAVQSLIAAGPTGNAGLEQLASLEQRLIELAPRMVQVYTLDRSPADASLRQAESVVLARLVQRLRLAGIDARTYDRTGG
jgi:wyosine [tRNA(Phe)-imidazoG37] synthetase (radical SAM superfamily)